jgi:hypothetical protein
MDTHLNTAGVVTTAVPVYVAECSPHQIRGLMVSIFQLLHNFGLFISSVFGGVLSMEWAQPTNVGWR